MTVGPCGIFDIWRSKSRFRLSKYRTLLHLQKEQTKKDRQDEKEILEGTEECVCKKTRMKKTVKSATSMPIHIVVQNTTCCLEIRAWIFHYTHSHRYIAIDTSSWIFTQRVETAVEERRKRNRREKEAKRRETKRQSWLCCLRSQLSELSEVIHRLLSLPLALPTKKKKHTNKEEEEERRVSSFSCRKSRLRNAW